MLVDQRYRKSLPELCFLVLDFEHGESVDISVRQRETVFVRPRFLPIFDATVCINIADLSSLPGWFLGCTCGSGRARAFEGADDAIDRLETPAVEAGRFL